MEKRGKNMSKLEKVIGKLINEELLDKRYFDHPLIGNYANHRECHIESDWLLIYRKFPPNALRLERTGSHADLF